jgi:membrane-associated phospholipid phosphatase
MLRPKTPKTALLGALACLIGLVVTGVLAYLVPVAHVRDSVTLEGFTTLNRPRLTPLIDDIAHLADPVPYALIGLALAAFALARRRGRVALAIVFLLVVTGVTTETLKPLLAHPRHSEWLAEGQIAAASWPSGHATASMTLALCGVLAMPQRLRPTAAAVGALFAIAVSYAILALGWHFPSDVIGGFLIAALWSLLVLAVLMRSAEMRPVRRPDPAAGAVDALGPIVLGAGAVAAVIAVTVARPDATADYALGHPTFVAGALAIAALATALAVGLARVVRS